MYKLIDIQVSLRFSTISTPTIPIGVTISSDEISYPLTFSGTNDAILKGPFNAKAIAVVNENTGSCYIKVQYIRQGVSKTLINVLLSSGDQLTYESGFGWKVLDYTGAIKGVGTCPAPNYDDILVSSTFDVLVDSNYNVISL